MALSARSLRPEPRDPTRVVFRDDFLVRLERFVSELAAARGREEVASRGRSAGGGEEFVAHRPYRPGEDLRDFDWELFARLERPFVRVRRREAGERWCVLLDTSASMGLGEPGKLQLAAEVTTAIAFSGLAAGASTRVLAFAPEANSEAIEAIGLRKRADLAGWMQFLAARRASGRRTLRSLAADARARGASRTFALGDLLDVEPRDLLALAGAGRSVASVRILAPFELAPALSGGVEWVDPETDERVDLRVSSAALSAYARELERRLELWRASFARHGQSSSVWSSAAAFEDVARSVLR